MKRVALLLLLSLYSAGCSVVNFSGNYYDLPSNYQMEISQMWGQLQTQLPLKDTYRIVIIDGKDSDRLDGVPAISNQMILLPIDFIRYIYQNYYDDRFKIMTSVAVHEITHPEYGFPSRPPKEHLKSDIAALKLLGDSQETAGHYYKSLAVVKAYWFARKGVGGHALNAGWNAANAVSLVVGGPAYFADWYATDLTERMKLIARQYHLRAGSRFPRSRGSY